MLISCIVYLLEQGWQNLASISLDQTELTLKLEKNTLSASLNLNDAII